MATDESGIVLKKLNELRVIDLKSELQKRGEDTNGVKAVLSTRLCEALKKEGNNNPEEHLFSITAETPKKSSRRSGGRTPTTGTAKDDIDSDAADMQLDGDNNDNDESNDGYNDGHKNESENKMEKSGMEAADIVEDAIQLTVDDELNEYREDTIIEETRSSVIKVNSKSSTSRNDVRLDVSSDDLASGMEDNGGISSPPKPENAPVIAPLTVDDILHLDSSRQRRTPTDDASMIVNIDDTQSELNDGDILDNSLLSNSNVLNHFDGESKENANSGQGKSSSGSKKKENENVGSSNKRGRESEKKSPNKDVQSKEKDGNGEKRHASSSAKEKDNKEATQNKAVTLTSKSKSSSSNSASKDNKSKAKEAVSKSSTTSKTGNKAVTQSSNSSPSKTSGSNIWVSGLSQKSAKAADLQNLFAKYGTVSSCKIITNPRLPKSSCYGLITMENAEQVTNCIKHLDKSDFNGNRVHLSRNRPQESDKKSSIRGKTISSSIKRDSIGKRVVQKSSSDSKLMKKESGDKKESSSAKGDSKEGIKKDEKVKKTEKSSEKSEKEKDKETKSKDGSKGTSVEISRNTAPFRRAPIRRPFGARFTSIPFRKPFGSNSYGRGGFSSFRRPAVSTMFGSRPTPYLPITERRLDYERRPFRDERPRTEYIRTQRDFDFVRKNREEKLMIEREKEKLRYEREKLEKERAELLRLDRERVEREKMERFEKEREEMRRRAAEQDLSAHRVDELPRGRLSIGALSKRPYQGRDSFRTTHDPYFDERKRLQQTQRDTHLSTARSFHAETPTTTSSRHAFDKSDSYKRRLDTVLPPSSTATASRSEYDTRRYEARHGQDRDDRRGTSFRDAGTRGSFSSRDRSRFGAAHAASRDEWKAPAHDARRDSRSSFVDKPIITSSSASGFGVRSYASGAASESRGGWSDRGGAGGSSLKPAYGTSGNVVTNYGSRQWNTSATTTGDGWHSSSNIGLSGTRNGQSSLITGASSLTAMFQPNVNTITGLPLPPAGGVTLPTNDRGYLHGNRRF